MKITLTTSGGFLGAKHLTFLDTSTLVDSNRKQLERLVLQANFFELPVCQLSTGTDLRVYTLLVDNGLESHQIEFDDGTTSPELARLVDAIAATESA